MISFLVNLKRLNFFKTVSKPQACDCDDGGPFGSVAMVATQRLFESVTNCDKNANAIKPPKFNYILHVCISDFYNF